MIELTTICTDMNAKGLSKVRLEAGFSNPAEAAQVFTINPATWYRWESGKEKLTRPGLIWWALRAWKHRKLIDQVEREAKETANKV